MPEPERNAFRRRFEDGQTVANKLNKMFWWLQPAAIPAIGGASDGPAISSLGLSCSGPVPIPQMNASIGNARQRSSSQGGTYRPHHNQQQQHFAMSQAPPLQQAPVGSLGNGNIGNNNPFAVGGSSHSFTNGSSSLMAHPQLLLRNEMQGSSNHHQPRLPRVSMPAGFSGYPSGPGGSNAGGYGGGFNSSSLTASAAAQQHQSNVQSIQSQLAALGGGLQHQHCLAQQQQLGLVPPPPPPSSFSSLMDPYASAPFPSAMLPVGPPTAAVGTQQHQQGSQQHMANLHAQAQLQQLIQSLYLN